MTDNDGWRWKVTDQETSGRMRLRYEPGNWGDVLKALWAIQIFEQWVSERQSGSPAQLGFLDPFAGRPHYPLTPESADRLSRVNRQFDTSPLSTWLDRGLVPSTGALVSTLAEERGIEFHSTVFDIDPESLDLWSARPRCEILDVRSGYDALRNPEALRANWILVDPYDLFDSWRKIVKEVVSLAQNRLVLLYLFNKSPRGEGFFRSYRDLRKTLRHMLQEQNEDAPSAVLGRIPADAILPRAHHEVILLGPTRSVETLRAPLTDLTEKLAWEIQREGVLEDPTAE